MHLQIFQTHKYNASHVLVKMSYIFHLHSNKTHAHDDYLIGLRVINMYYIYIILICIIFMYSSLCFLGSRRVPLENLEKIFNLRDRAIVLLYRNNTFKVTQKKSAEKFLFEINGLRNRIFRFLNLCRKFCMFE